MSFGLLSVGYPNIFDDPSIDFAIGNPVSDIFDLSFQIILAIAAYILQAVAVSNMLKTVGYKKPWLAWVPIANSRALGDLADMYDDGKPPKNLGKRMVFYLSFAACASVLWGILVAFYNVAVVSGVESRILIADLILSVVEILVFAMLLTFTVYQLIALHKIYRIFQPLSATLFTVLSVFLNYAPAVILFVIRTKEPQNLRGDKNRNDSNIGEDGFTPYNYDEDGRE